MAKTSARLNYTKKDDNQVKKNGERVEGAQAHGGKTPPGVKLLVITRSSVPNSLPGSCYGYYCHYCSLSETPAKIPDVPAKIRAPLCKALHRDVARDNPCPEEFPLYLDRRKGRKEKY